MSESELAELDLAVARAEGLHADLYDNGRVYVVREEVCDIYQPTRDPGEAMRLLVRHHLTLSMKGDQWACWRITRRVRDFYVTGTTPCIAIARAIVALHAKP